MRQVTLVAFFGVCCLHAQTFKGHHIGESPTEFFSAEPRLQTHLDECKATAPRPLTDEEVKDKFGNRVLKDLIKRRASDSAGSKTEIMSTNPDVYGDRCGGLLAIANGKDIHVDGTGYDFTNAYSRKILEMSPPGSSMSAIEQHIELMKQLEDNRTWRGDSADNRQFTFVNSNLVAFGVTLEASFEDVTEDVTKKLNIKPVEVLTPMHNAYGATWSDPTFTWDTLEVHVSLTENRNPANHSPPRLEIEAESIYKSALDKQKNRPSTID